MNDVGATDPGPSAPMLAAYSVMAVACTALDAALDAALLPDVLDHDRGVHSEWVHEPHTPH
jgi:hypothetical protein